MNPSQPIRLTRFAWLSIGAAVITILLKLLAYWLTNSVGFLSDALESFVNLATAIVALGALSIAAKPADDEYSYGYSKIEYFSSGFEGGMILLAAGTIVVSAIPRLINPQPLEQIGIGLVISVVASLVNFFVSRVLMNAGKKYNSLTLESDAKHLMTDVFTTVGVIAGVGLVAISGWERLDPIIALIVAANILVTGIKLLRHAGHGLMDASLPEVQVTEIQKTIKPYTEQGVEFHALRTRSSAARGYVSMHALVPGNWSVKQAHDLAETIEKDIRQKEPNLAVFIHVEPLEDPASFQDINLDRS